MTLASFASFAASIIALIHGQSGLAQVLWIASAALIALDIAASCITFQRIGGLYHWRMGRIGGSVYIARK